MQCSIKTSEVDLNKIFWWKIFSTDHKIIWKCIYHETKQKTNPPIQLKCILLTLALSQIALCDEKCWYYVQVKMAIPSVQGRDWSMAIYRNESALCSRLILVRKDVTSLLTGWCLGSFPNKSIFMYTKQKITNFKLNLWRCYLFLYWNMWFGP